MTDKILIDRSMLEQALKVLEYAANDVLTGRNAAAALSAALEQPQVEQEPVAWMDTETRVLYDHDTSEVDQHHGFKPTVPLYTHPQPPALEQPVKQEPVGKLIADPYEGHIFIPYGDSWPFNEDLYTHPQPKRNPLTQEQIEAGIWNLGSMDTIERESNTQFARAIERTHGIGGSMNQQPEVLRLADAIGRYNAGVHSQAIVEEYSKAAAAAQLGLARAAAAELRRLYWDELRVREHRDEMCAEVTRLHALNQELMEALKGFISIVEDSDGVSGYHLNGSVAGWSEFPELEAAWVVMCKAEGETK